MSHTRNIHKMTVIVASVSVTCIYSQIFNIYIYLNILKYISSHKKGFSSWQIALMFDLQLKQTTQFDAIVLLMFVK